MIELFIVFFGIIIGSFLNVVIYRLPMRQSLAVPASYCPECGYRLSWIDLIPILGYFLLKGKCRKCQKSISWQYPATELFTGVVFLFLYYCYGFSQKLIVGMVFVSVLIPIISIDIKYQIIPDTINLFGGLMGLFVVFFTNLSFLDALSGGLFGGAIMLLIAIISRGGMGGGDIKMMAWMGLFLGWKLTLVALFLSFVIGGLGSLMLILCGIKKRKDFIPFGPFLAIGGFAAYVFGYEILRWYFKML